MKRLFDLSLAIVSMIIFSLPMAVIYLVILIGGGGDVIYKQERIGYHGRPFTLYKFRSMKTNAEMDGQPMLYLNNDPRLTRIGRFLRAHHIDELPQLWNIIRGDMSFVGPRPERRYFIDQIVALRPDYTRLYALRPGIFSKATLFNGYTYNMDKMIQRLHMDLEYLEKQSLSYDLKIIWLTTWAIISGKKF